MKKFILNLNSWLESRFCTPSYAGWILGGVGICFFGAATNTMVGWLYAMSGIIFSLMGLAAVLAWRSLKEIQVRRLPILPISAGDELTVTVEVINASQKPKTLLQVWDLLPFVLSPPKQIPIELIASQGTYSWVYHLTPQRRGVYSWGEVQLRTGNPLGLFWCRRSREVHSKAVVYPQVLPLKSCPLVDSLGQDESNQFISERRHKSSTEGLTRALRPYRIGDPTRLIHWRSSARYGDLRVRELEIATGGEEVIICLDSAASWESEAFESAVVAVASLYFYAASCQMDAKFWSASSGLIQGQQIVLETLAAISQGEDLLHHQLPSQAIIWLTANPSSLNSLPSGSRWVLFPENPEAIHKQTKLLVPGLIINPENPLQTQLMSDN